LAGFCPWRTRRSCPVVGKRILMSMTTITPKKIRADQSRIAIEWSDAHASVYTPRDLRLACVCAACVDEWTRKSLVRSDQIPLQIKATKIDVVGNYALQFYWSDGHSSGIYAYDYLRSLCACDDCKKPREFDV
jgi:DUF971 family protein